MSTQLEPQADLTPAAAATRAAIVDAAVRCDWEALRSLATVDDAFLYRLGDPGGDPIDHWQNLETNPDVPAALRTPLRTLVIALRAPHDRAATSDQPYVWPSSTIAMVVDDPTLAELKALYPPESWTLYKQNGYSGARTAIGPDGSWVLYLTGD